MTPLASPLVLLVLLMTATPQMPSGGLPAACAMPKSAATFTASMPPHAPPLHPLVVATLQVLLSVMSLLAFSPNAADKASVPSPQPTRRRLREWRKPGCLSKA